MALPMRWLILWGVPDSVEDVMRDWKNNAALDLGAASAFRDFFSPCCVSIAHGGGAQPPRREWLRPRMCERNALGIFIRGTTQRTRHQCRFAGRTSQLGSKAVLLFHTRSLVCNATVSTPHMHLESGERGSLQPPA